MSSRCISIPVRRSMCVNINSLAATDNVEFTFTRVRSAA